MLEAMKTEMNKTYTENGAVTERTSGSDCLDLFATIGALRHAEDKEIISRFIRAWIEDKNMALKISFFGRDVRGGLGERRVFRTILKWLADNEPDTVRKNIALISEYGRWDDILCLLGTECENSAIDCIAHQLEIDLHEMKRGNSVSLLAKWLPSANASSAETVRNAKKICAALGIKEKEYRKKLVALRRYIQILENNLRLKDYSFDYAGQPAGAMLKYKAAFWRNDACRYGAFLEKVSAGEEKLHTETLAPYQLVDPYIGDNYYTDSNESFMGKLKAREKLSLNTTWESLPEFGNGENAIAVIDTSSSMYWQQDPKPASVALSLGLYFAEHNTGFFNNHIMEFSSQPRLIELKGETFVDRLRYAASLNEIGSTNIEAVFSVILETAVKHDIPQEDMPSAMYIISDMEFDNCISGADKSNFENARQKFEQNGYRLPKIVFWNVASRNRQQPVTMNESGVTLVSGCSPMLFSKVMDDSCTPYTCMLDIINSERYQPISA